MQPPKLLDEMKIKKVNDLLSHIWIGIKWNYRLKSVARMLKEEVTEFLGVILVLLASLLMTPIAFIFVVWNIAAHFLCPLWLPFTTSDKTFWEKHTHKKN